jgi:predicted membrane protein
MDVMLFIVSLLIAFSLLVTTLGAIGFLVFLFLLFMESFEKKKMSHNVVSDFMTPTQRIT